MNPIALVRRLRHSEWLAPVRRHLPLAATVAGVASTRRGPRRGLLLLTLGGAGFVRTWRRSRALGRAATDEHLARMRRLRRDVLQRFYIECIGSMEAELEEYPEYDRRKHELRYRVVSDLASAHAPTGGVVVDVGCASGLVLDAVHRARHTRGVGFDLAPYGVRQRAHRPDPPVLAQAVVEHIPLRDGIADVVVFSEVIEHLLDAYAGLREVSRITRDGGVMILTTNNGSEMPVISPLRDPLSWVERLGGRWRPRWLAFRNLTWHDPIDRRVDPLPPEAPTYVPHLHFCFAELRDLAADAGFQLISSGSFEFPAPQSPFADRLRRLTSRAPRLGNGVADVLERTASMTPGLSLMGTHHLLVFRRVAAPRPRPRIPWWPAHLPDGPPLDALEAGDQESISAASCSSSPAA
jgi:SAM-dependent methyltransferase